MRLEDMMAEWESRNITVNYNFEDSPDPNSITNVISNYKRAMASNLAKDLIADFNKQVPLTLLQQASSSLDSLSGRIALERLNQVAYPRRQPVGSGNSLRWNRWARFYRDYEGNANVNKSEQIYVGDINDYVEHFDGFLEEDETLSSFDIQLDTGLNLESSSIDGNDILYRIKAESQNNEFNNYPSQVTIIATTSSGRVQARVIYFSVVGLPRVQ